MHVLEGIRVIDLTMWAFVPSAGGVLSHWGADVIKVEHPRSPDPMRTFAGTTLPNGVNWMFEHYNRGKRAITLDLGSEAGREVLYRLVDDADVFLTSFLPATRQKLGFDVDHIRARNPRIVYAKGTGQGPLGPDAERGGYDGATWWCRGGLADATGRAAGSDYPPAMVGHGDGLSGLTLAGGICAALLHRERTGEAQVVDASLLGMAMWLLGPAIVGGKVTGAATFGPDPVRERRDPLLNIYRTSDGRFLVLNAMGGDADWAELCQCMGRDDLADDLRFSTSGQRSDHRGEAIEALDAVFGERSLDEWKDVLAATHAVWSPVQTARELHDDPQTLANGFVRDIHGPTGEALSVVAPPVLFDQDSYGPSPAPAWGQHTNEVLSEAGYSTEELSALRASGVVA